jgi:hypothetical protein
MKCRKQRRWAATAAAIQTPAGYVFSLVEPRRPACSCSRSARALRFLAAAPINRQAPMQRPGALGQPEPPSRMAGRRRREPRARAAHPTELLEWAAAQTEPAGAVRPRRQEVETRRARPPRAAQAATAGPVVSALACLEQLAGPTSRRCLAGQALAIDTRLDASLLGAPVLRMARSATTDIYKW